MRQGFGVFLIILAAFFALLSHATSFIERPFPEMVSDAPVIARGRAGSSYTNWVLGSDGSKRIYTFTELNLDEVLKGKTSAANRLIMRELGGEKDGVGMEVPGTAQFNRGEDVVVFLGLENADGSHDLHGMMMGKFNLEKGDDGKDYLMGAGMKAHSHSGPHHRGHDDTPNERKWSLDDLRELIKAPAEAAPPAPKTEPSPRLTPVNTPPAHDHDHGSSAAPQLQNSTPEDAGFPWAWALGLVLAGGIGFLTFARKR